MLTIKNPAAKKPEGFSVRAEARCGPGLRVYLPNAIVASFALLGLCAGCTPPGARALLEGQRLIERGNYPQALVQLKRASSLLATNAHAWNYLALAFHYSGQLLEAEHAYRRALALDHDLTAAHYNLACLWLAQNKPDRTEAAKTELLAYTLRRGNTPEGLLKLGVAQLRCREWAGAEKSFNDALRLRPECPEALNGLALIRLQRGQIDEAAKIWQATHNRYPGYPPAVINLAIVTQQYLKDRARALQMYRKYLALKPTPADAKAVETVARELEQELNTPRGRLSEAPSVQLVRGSVPERTPDVILPATAPAPATNSPKPMANISRATLSPKLEFLTNASRQSQPLETNSAPTAAVQLVKLSDQPTFMPARDLPDLRGNVETSSVVAEPTTSEAPTPLLHKPQPSRAQPNTKQARRGFLQRINPFNFLRGEPQERSHPTPLPPVRDVPPPESMELVERPKNVGNALPVDSAFPRYRYLSPTAPAAGNRREAQPIFDQGIRAHHAQQLADALQKYRHAIQMDPAFFEAHYNLALAAAEAKDLPGSLAAYEHALALRPESLDARYNFALALKQANFAVDAANELEKLLSSAPYEGRANLALGNLYAEQLRQPTKARQCYMRVLEKDPQNAQASAIRYWLAANPF